MKRKGWKIAPAQGGSRKADAAYEQALGEAAETFFQDLIACPTHVLSPIGDPE